MKIRLIITSFFSICISFAFSQSKHAVDLRNYKPISDTFTRRENLVKYVIPDKNYTYWEFDRGERDTARSGEVLFSSGVKPPGTIIKDPRGSLFIDCLPAFCYKYIAYVYNGKVGYITNDKDFITFMGKIDNFQEAILLAEISEQLYPDNDKIGGSYLVTPAGFQLMLTKYTTCPQTKQAIQVNVGPLGIIKKINRKVYFKSTGCVVI